MGSAEALRALLDEAYAAMRDGEAVEAERRARAVSALIRAEKELAELEAAQEQEPEDNADAIRADLLGRLHRLVAAHRDGASLEELRDSGASGLTRRSVRRQALGGLGCF